MRKLIRTIIYPPVVIRMLLANIGLVVGTLSIKDGWPLVGWPLVVIGCWNLGTLGGLALAKTNPMR